MQAHSLMQQMQVPNGGFSMRFPSCCYRIPSFRFLQVNQSGKWSIRCGTDDFPGLDALLAFLIGMEAAGFNQFSR